MSVVLYLRRSIAKSRHLLTVDVRTTHVTSREITIGGLGGIHHVTKSMEASTAMMYQKSHGFHSSRKSNFRSTARVLLPVRRRRRGTARKIEIPADDSTSDENDSTNTLQRIHAPVTNSIEFDQASSRLLDKIERAVEPMKANNTVFITKRSDGELGEIFTIDLGPKLGLYQIEMSQDEHVFEYSSPISGRLLYCLSSTTGEWINIDDGHQFEGILVRDLLRSNCIGLPNL